MKFLNIKNKKFICGLICALGVIFCMIGIFCGFIKSNHSNKGKTTAVISGISSYKGSDGERHYGVFVQYTIDEKKYQAKLNNYSDSYYEGQELKIYYNKQNPKEIEVRKTDIAGIIFLVAGALFIIGGGAGIIYLIKNDTKKEGLTQA